MSYNLGVCPNCSNVMSMPDDSATVRCPSCKQVVSAAEAASLAGDASEQARDQAVRKATRASGNQADTAGEPGSPIVRTWQTNVPFTILGIAAGAVIAFFSPQLQQQIAGPFFALAFLVFVIVYALKLYPSLFTDRPFFESNAAISFMNGFVGGIIWGLLWNRNLTLGKPGVSHLVFVGLIAVCIILVIVGGLLLVPPTAVAPA